MSEIFTILFTTILCSMTFGQKHIGVHILSDDGSTATWEIKHMWVGQKNEIYGNGEILKLWTDNGKVDIKTYSTAECCGTPSQEIIHKIYYIVPEKSGRTTVYATQVFNDDTITTRSVFTSIIPPSIKLQIIDDSYKRDSTIKFVLIDILTNKKLSNRYKVGRMFEPNIFNSQDSLIGFIPACFGTTISNGNFRISEMKIEKGYKMKIMLLVRDLKTDLLVWTKEAIYKFE